MTELLEENRDRLDEAMRFITNHPNPSAVELQAHFKIGWERAQNLVEVLQERGLWPKCPTRQGLKRTCLLYKGHTRGHIFEP